jgi:hypothetical protein
VNLWLPMILTPIGAIIASSGFWAYVQHKDSTKDAMTRLMMGMAYNHITTVGIKHIKRGWISKDEYEEFRKYFFEPYKALGGNGVAERIMNEVTSLPFVPKSQYEDILTQRQSQVFINNVRTNSEESHAE